MRFISYSMYFDLAAGRLVRNGAKMRHADYNLGQPGRLESFAVCWDVYDKTAARS
jgi:hypothetical protein